MKFKAQSIFHNKMFRRILVLFLLPTFLLSISLIITYNINFHNNNKQMQQNYASSLKLYSLVCEAEILNVLRSVSTLFIYSPGLMDFLQDKIELDALGTRYDVTSVISQFKSSNEIIDDIFIMNKSKKKIISMDGVYPYDDFFNNMYVYDNYNHDYWRSFEFFGRMQYQILSPSKVHSDGKDSVIIPIVFRSISNVRFSKYIVINISLDSLLSSNNSYRLTDNTSVFILNRYSGDVFGNDKQHELENILNTPLYKKLIDSPHCFDYSFNGEKMLVVSHSFSDNLLGYTYFVTIPYSDIIKMQSSIFIPTIVIYIVFLLLTLYFSTLNAKKLANPLNNIATFQYKDTKFDSGSIFDHINSSIASIKKQQADNEKALHYAQEKYLINFLNSADFYIDEASRDIIKASLPFKNDYYASVIFQVFPKQEFFNSFSSNECDNIFSELYNIIKSIFYEKLDAFILSSERETLYVIINADENHLIDNVHAKLSEICNILQYDSNYLNIYTGIGNFYHDLNGLKISHKEAVNSLKPIPSAISKTTFLGSTNTAYILSEAEESKLYNMLISLDISSSQEFINQTLSSIDDPHVSKLIHTQILNILLRVMQTKKLITNDLFNDYISVLNKSANDIYLYILVLISNLETYKSSMETIGNINEIIDYINQNFKDDSLSLEHLASLFNVNPTPLSRTIKKYLGIGFHEYISNLRILYAQNLLLNSNNSVEEIYKEAGFYSKQTFFRLFKKTVGMTPSVYRKANKGNHKPQ